MIQRQGTKIIVTKNPADKEENLKVKGASIQQQQQQNNRIADTYDLMSLICGGGTNNRSIRQQQRTSFKGASTLTRVKNFNTDSNSEKIMKTYDLAKLIVGLR